MEIQKARDWVDFLLKSVTIIAIIAGGAWAVYQFTVIGSTDTNIQVLVSAETQAYSDTQSLLVIHVKPKNIGKVMVRPGQDGLLVTVRKIPGDAKDGIMRLDALPLTYSTDLLKRYLDGYEIEPGAEYDEILTIVVPKGSMYAVRAELDLGNEDEVDHTTVVRAEPTGNGVK
ncbi:hypothetical protein LT85_1345 [Collimonas arenae]|uniref:Uncharacterized protein n=1 Tax=Collimonas arenae TaxID=279058 RepID=A0A0A1F6Z6_9BURK|nr:hypothetical protein [Collimonas arenae]AIY40503.1 hypothetical protein LT85_1345 [Collimonas arenae]